MVIEVQYKKDAAERHAVIHLEYFESVAMPSKEKIVQILTQDKKDFDEKSISIVETKRDATAARSSGLRVRKI